MSVAQIMTILPILAIVLFLVISFAAWRVWLEHRHYDEFVRMLEKRPSASPVRAIAAVQGGGAQRPVQLRPRMERAAGSLRGASAQTRRFRIVES